NPDHYLKRILFLPALLISLFTNINNCVFSYKFIYMEQQRFRSFEKRETNQMVFGIRAIMEAIQSGQEIESLFLQRGLSGPLMQELRQILRDYEVPYQQVPLEKLNRITRKNHQGAIAVISPITYNKIENIVPM